MSFWKGETAKRWKKVSLIFAGIVFLLTGFVAFVLPGMVKSQVVQRVEAATGRRLHIGGMSFNPLTWTVGIRDVRFSELGGGETFVAFSSARLTVNPLLLYRGEKSITAAHITSPHFRVVRVGENSYNFTDLLQWLPLHPRLSVNNLTITNGSVDFIDQALPVEKRHELRNVELALPFITTMHYYADRYITPHLSAVLNGSPLHLEGSLRPFPRADEATITVEFKDLSLPHYLAYIPGQLPVRIESGRMSAKLALSYGTAQNKSPEVALRGRMSLADVKLSDRTGAPFLAVKQLDTEIARALLPLGDFDLTTFFVDGLEVFLTRDNKGIFSHSRLVGQSPPGTPPRRKMLVNVKESRLRNGRLHFIDNLPPGGFTTDVEAISLDMRDYSTAPGGRASYTLALTTLRGEKGRAQGEFSLRPLATASSIELVGVKLAAYSPYFPSLRRARVEGDLDIAGHLDFGGPQGTTLEKVSAQVRQLSLSLGKSRKITLGALSLDGGTFSGKGTEREVRIESVSTQGSSLTFVDQQVTGGYSTTLSALGGRILGLSSAKNSIADVDLHGELENRSPLKITGQINPLRVDLFADLKVTFAAIELAPLSPYSVTYLGYTVDKGKLFLDANYLLKDKKIDLQNRIRINQLTFGRRTASNQEISPSVQLAVALFKDREGEIRFDLPVSGQLDDPQFSLPHLVLELLKNLLTTAQEAPFTLLQTVSGVKEDLSHVVFAPGSSELSPREQGKLLKLATILNDRPALKIKLVGFVEKNAARYEEERLRRLAEARVSQVRNFLVEQGKMDGARLLLKSGEMDGDPALESERGNRIEFEIAIE